MKGFKLFIALFILFFTWNGSSLAQTPEKCITKPIVIVFGNGVDNKFREIIKSWKVLSREVQSYFKNQGVSLSSTTSEECRPIQFAVQPNPTDGVTRDLLESLVQVFTSDDSRFWRLLSGVEDLDDATRAEFERLAIQAEKFALNNPVILDFVNKYNARLSDGETIIIVVSHSQGNFFSNLIYQNVDVSFRNRLHIVSVANPDTFVAGFPPGEGPYTTLEEDLVIRAIRIIKVANGVPGPMLANTRNTPPTADKSGHKFLQSYIAAGTTSKAEILDDISSFIPVENIGECFLPPNPSLQDLYNECICLNPNDPACICWLDNTLPHCSGD